MSLAPALTDCVYALGSGGLLVGRSAWCHRPAEVDTLPVVGGYQEARDDRLEALQPDLILCTSAVQDALARRLADEGRPVYQVPLPSSPWGILDSVVTVAAVLGRPEAAAPVLDRLTAAMQELGGSLPGVPTYVEIDLGGPITCGTGSFVYWALSWLGLRVLTAGDRRAYFEPDDAWLRELQPRLVVFDPQPHRSQTEQTVVERLAERGLVGWFESGGRVVVTEGDVLAHSGPWLISDGLPRLVRQVAAA